MGKIKRNVEDKEKRSLLVAQDIKLVKALAGNDRKLRDRALKNLKKWLEQRSSKMAYTKEDFIRLWKGLFYMMWMSDKPLVQEECAEKIAQLIHFSDPESSLLFFKCALIVMATEWFGIDQLRLDKFLMFVRRILRQAFVVLKRNNWKLELVTEFGNILLKTILKKDNSTYLGLTMHITEVYLEELAKASNGEIDEHLVTEFIKPFIKQLSVLADNRQAIHMRKYMFHHLLHQSDEGIEYHVKFEAWKGRGFPGGSIDAMQKIEAASDEDMSDTEEKEEERKLEEKPLDPRAGHVNVDLPQLPLDAKEISLLLLKHRFVEGSTTKTRKVIAKLAEDFEQLSKGVFPLGIKEIRLPGKDGYSTKLKKSVNRLVKFEKSLLADSNKNRKRKRRNNREDLEESNTNELDIDGNANQKHTHRDNQKETLEKPKASTLTNGDQNKKRKRKKNQNEEETETDIELMGMTGLFKDKLQQFIEKSEGSLMNGVDIAKKKKLHPKSLKVMKKKVMKKRPKSNATDDWEYENHFQRNSGTWIVHCFDDLDSSQVSKKSFISSVDVSVDKYSANIKQNGESNTPKTKPMKNHKVIENSEDKLPSEVTKKHNVPLFSQSEWDVPPKEGEVEIFVPSNRFKNKMEKLAKKSGKNPKEFLSSSISNLVKTRYSLCSDSDSINNMAKKRYSLDPKLVKNPFAKLHITPKSEKKVKIDLKLNRSQEIHEHQAQLRSSPAIPYDASKKPLKPLLKPHVVSSPINPFYKKKFKLL